MLELDFIDPFAAIKKPREKHEAL